MAVETRDALVDRRTQLPTDGVACPNCWEAMHFVRPYHDGPGTWRHRRTGRVACAPICDGCQAAPGTHAIGADEFDGARVRFVVRNFLCEDCVEARGAHVERL